MIRLTIPNISREDIQSVEMVLKSGFLVQAEKVRLFEKSITDYTEAKYAVAVSNCTAALHLSLLVLDVKPGDLVFVTSYSWPATANVIELCGAVPIFVDIDRDTFNMSPVDLADKIERLHKAGNNFNRVKAIIPVHAFGQTADMKTIIKIAKKYYIPVLEDAACALGATLNGKHAGTFGTLGCFSFHPRKAITTGEGGIIVTNSKGLADKLRALRNHGLDPNSSSPDFIMPGFNYRMTEFQAAFGISQMNKIRKIIAVRRKRAAYYDKLLSGTSIQFPQTIDGAEHVYQSYVILIPEKSAPKCSKIIAEMRRNNIETTIGTWYIPVTTYYKNKYGYKRDSFPVTDAVFSRAITLPLHDKLKVSEQKCVVKKLIEQL
ncbi:MAG: DegT/DnrJ/EryC1/StrS family aminotransferase [Planctomycetes bacterium]|nr:DegT/DnrJ/EryC1/StrS family aminotransferase [Planctomycetota bacterium]MBU1518336.1 DegT/DnrJ/EryC1/StrS family aminotransferase [Planctomycetota bacterium]MBU2458571.1 DegT/DnrJ/EryC1/StrS family aminotransferase [Planctomycetota bacterium]MBU2596041.1 DegT/DnrJ/EryC1/StrS family aminotransferase [Planctomycetota bacterium]